ncbi:MAG: alpha/beta hydrolase [Clostridiales bacterium]|nr:alpha/beta hydrolase [Clostridiales bacterium]
MPQISVYGQPAFYRTSGEGPKAVMFLHGAGGNSLHWLGTEPPTGWRVIAVDLPGHGNSGGDPRNGIFQYADWVAEFIRTLGERPVLAGHSMGGAVAMTVALSVPELLKGLILVGTGAKLGVSPMILNLCQGNSTLEIEDLMAKMAYGSLPTWEQIKDWYQLFGQATCQAYFADFTACDRFDIRERVSEISLPTLVVCGSEDRLTPKKYSQYLASQIPKARLVEIPEAGHMVMLEQAKLFNLAVKEFCENLKEEI